MESIWEYLPELSLHSLGDPDAGRSGRHRHYERARRPCMQVIIPRVVIAGIYSGCGKTTIGSGLIAALKGSVSSHSIPIPLWGYEFHNSRTECNHGARFAIRLAQGKGIQDGKDGITEKKSSKLTHTRTSVVRFAGVSLLPLRISGGTGR